MALGDYFANWTMDRRGDMSRTRRTDAFHVIGSEIESFI